MASEVNQADLPLYTGSFSRDPKLLEKYLEQAEGYFSRDPKTWPVVTSAYLANYLGHEYDGSWLLPPYIAYERVLVDKCVSSFADAVIDVETAEGGIIQRRTYHHHFPFVFNHLSVAHREEYMTANDYTRYVQELAGLWQGTENESTYALSLIRAAEDFADKKPDLMEKYLKKAQGELETHKFKLNKAQLEFDQQKRQSDVAITDLHHELAQMQKRAELAEEQCKKRKEEVSRLHKALERANMKNTQLKRAKPVTRSDRVEKQQQRRDMSTLTRVVAAAHQGLAHVHEGVFIVGTANAGFLNPGTPNMGTPNVGALNVGALSLGTPNMGTPNMGTPNMGTPNVGAPSMGLAFRDRPNAGLAQVRVKREEF